MGTGVSLKRIATSKFISISAVAPPSVHPCACGCCLPRLPVSLPCLRLLRFGSTNNCHRTGTKSTDFFGRPEYFLLSSTHIRNPYSLFTAAQFLRRLASISLLDFFAICFIMVLCKFIFVWIYKKAEKQPILAQKQPIFCLQKSR